VVALAACGGRGTSRDGAMRDIAPSIIGLGHLTHHRRALKKGSGAYFAALVGALVRHRSTRSVKTPLWTALVSQRRPTRLPTPPVTECGTVGDVGPGRRYRN
jgi:hypothetical protein